MIYDATHSYPRDLKGYGDNPPHPQWPNGARIAVQFVLNYEEGGENAVLHGDATSETFLSELFAPSAYPNRHMSMEGIYEYGSRVGVWRILREFRERGLPLTVFGIATALARYPEMVGAFMDDGHEIAGHGWKWIHYQDVDPALEAEHLRLAMTIMSELTGEPAQGPRHLHGAGWYTGRDSPNTRRLIADYGGFEYDSDYYGDELPFWMKVRRTDGTVVPQLIVPYTLDCNDMRFSLPQGFSYADPFFQYLKDTFDVLYKEGDPDGQNAPKMMSIGMHCRLLGRPGRIVALQRFLDHIQSHQQVWVCRRIDIARHWRQTFPYETTKSQ
jgi:putative urate catabolism protein